MNNNFSNSEGFPGTPLYVDGNPVPNQQTAPYTTAQADAMAGMPIYEESYIENILRLNKGKQVEIYTSYPDATEWHDHVFSGIIEQSGRDHIILSDPKTGKWYLVLMIYVNYVKFDERIIYSPDFYPSNWKSPKSLL